MAFRIGTSGTDAQFGELCPRSPPAGDGSTWSITDLTNFTDKVNPAIWVCPPSGCRISGKNDFDTLYSSPSISDQPDKVVLELIPEAKEIHANTYVCETDPYGSGGATYNYDITIYGNLNRLQRFLKKRNSKKPG